MNETTLLEWQPGDGVRCTYAATAPSELPCGPPIKTKVLHLSQARRKTSYVRKPLCARHCGEAPLPGAVLKQARKAAAEQVIVENYERYQQLVADAISSARELAALEIGLKGGRAG